jgi:hypothetical protein
VTRQAGSQRIILLRCIMAAIAGAMFCRISSQQFNEIVETLFAALSAAHCSAA